MSEEKVSLRNYDQEEIIKKLKAENEKLKKALAGLIPLCICNNQEHSRRISFAGEALEESEEHFKGELKTTTRERGI